MLALASNIRAGRDADLIRSVRGEITHEFPAGRRGVSTNVLGAGGQVTTSVHSRSLCDRHKEAVANSFVW